MRSSILGIIILSSFITGCSNASMSRYKSYGSHHIVTLYSGGNVVGVWETDGMIENENYSDGYFSWMLRLRIQ